MWLTRVSFLLIFENVFLLYLFNMLVGCKEIFRFLSRLFPELCTIRKEWYVITFWKFTNTQVFKSSSLNSKVIVKNLPSCTPTGKCFVILLIQAILWGSARNASNYDLLLWLRVKQIPHLYYATNTGWNLLRWCLELEILLVKLTHLWMSRDPATFC